MIIGIDIGGTNIRIGLLDSKKQKLLKLVSFPVEKDFNKTIKRITSQTKILTGKNSIKGIGWRYKHQRRLY